jgi:hypothetical protein
MTDIEAVNKDSWELAVISIVKKGKSFEPYSTSQIRKLMSASQSSDYLTRIPKILHDYTPAPPQGVGGNEVSAQKEMKQKREKNNQFGELLMELMQECDSIYVQRLLKYTIWNIKIIEKNLGKGMNRLSLLLECEGVENGAQLLSELDRQVNTPTIQNKKYKKNVRNLNKFDRRKT